MRPIAQVKRLPDDFRVEEETDVRPSGGEFALYRMTKRGIGTLEAIEFIARSWNIPRRRIQFGGMKDRHAVTKQYVTIHGGPESDFHVANVALEYLGRVSRAFGPRDILGNRFRIVLRKIQPADTQLLDGALREVSEFGLPNYFDDQRFRSLGPSGDFVARAWCQGDYERALWLALAEENPSDTAEERAQKERLRAAWGAWADVKELLTRSHRRSIVTFLVDHPQDFRGAFVRVRVELRRIYLAAFQSHLWNRVVAEIVREAVPEKACAFLPSVFGELPAPKRPTEEQRRVLEGLRIPLPSSRARIADAALAARFERHTGALGLTIAGLRVKHGRDAFFPTATRAAWMRPNGLDARWHDDEVHPGRRSLELSFALGRGSYATLVLKRVLAARGRSSMEALPDDLDA